MCDIRRFGRGQQLGTEREEFGKKRALGQTETPRPISGTAYASEGPAQKRRMPRRTAAKREQT
jgi:hypothetical protein